MIYMYLVALGVELFLNPLNHESDLNIISPSNNNAEANVKTIRVKEMITNSRKLNC